MHQGKVWPFQVLNQPGVLSSSVTGGCGNERNSPGVLAASTLIIFLGRKFPVTLPKSTAAVRGLQLWVFGEDGALGLL